MTEFDVLGAAAAGMDAQRAALNVAARNVAAAETGEAFARLVPRYVLPPEPTEAADDIDAVLAAVPGDEAIGVGDDGSGDVVRFAGTTQMPGIAADSIAEMVAVLNAQRAYEANASVFEAGKRLAERTIDVGRP